MTTARLFRWTLGAVFLLSCNGDVEGPDPGPDPSPLPGSLLVNVSTTGGTLDGDGYGVELDGALIEQVAVNGALEIADVPSGEHAVTLTGLADNCTVPFSPLRNVLVSPGEPVTANFSVRCDSLLRNVILFTRVHDRVFTIYWTSPQGSPPVRITEGSAPAVSPDGSRIAFARYGLNMGIWVAKVDGTEPLRLTNTGAADQWPDWSPDGQFIVFASDRDGNHEIYIMRSDGSDERRLTRNSVQDSRPLWSPDGTRIAFTRMLDMVGNTEIFMINPDGTGELNVTRHPESDEMMSWSPQGDRLLINSTRAPPGLGNELFRIDLDGSNAVNLTNHPAYEGTAAWSPGGDAIVFDSSRDSDVLGLYRADADGRNVVRLTMPGPGEWDFNPDWAR